MKGYLKSGLRLLSISRSSWTANIVEYRGERRITGTCAMLLLPGLAAMLGGCQSIGPVTSLDSASGAAQAPVSYEKGSLSLGRSANGAGKSYGQAGQKQNIASLSEIIRRNPQDVGALNLRGAAWAKAGDYRRAMADFTAAIDLDPQYYQAFANRALVYVRLKKPNEAMADYERALAIRPDYKLALLGRADLYRKARIFPRALADYGKVIEIDPSNDLAYYQRAVT
jgi:tetratricopeptide (TPR) repeat protein